MPLVYFGNQLLFQIDFIVFYMKLISYVHVVLKKTLCAFVW